MFAGIELGGTKIICTLGSGPDHVIASERIPTGLPDETLSEIETVLDAWLADNRSIAAIGAASFGPLDLDPASQCYGQIIQTSKPGWSGTDVASRLARRYGLPVGFDTDVNGAALAEGRWGGAKGLQSWIYITIGTGVGAGIVINGRTARGLGHSEAGHMVVHSAPRDNWPGICPYHGDCVEGLVSGPAIAARSGIAGENIAVDHPVWVDVAYTIGAMIHNLVMVGAPQRIMLGGGVIERRPELFPAIRRAVTESLADYAHAASVERDIDQFIVPPALGRRAGPLGALALASDAFDAAVPRLDPVTA